MTVATGFVEVGNPLTKTYYGFDHMWVYLGLGFIVKNGPTGELVFTVEEPLTYYQVERGTEDMGIYRRTKDTNYYTLRSFTPTNVYTLSWFLSDTKLTKGLDVGDIHGSYVNLEGETIYYGSSWWERSGDTLVGKGAEHGTDDMTVTEKYPQRYLRDLTEAHQLDRDGNPTIAGNYNFENTDGSLDKSKRVKVGRPQFSVHETNDPTSLEYDHLYWLGTNFYSNLRTNSGTSITGMFKELHQESVSGSDCQYVFGIKTQTQYVSWDPNVWIITIRWIGMSDFPLPIEGGDPSPIYFYQKVRDVWEGTTVVTKIPFPDGTTEKYLHYDHLVVGFEFGKIMKGGRYKWI